MVMAIERTLSIIKPDATRRNLSGKINARFEDADRECSFNTLETPRGQLLRLGGWI